MKMVIERRQSALAAAAQALLADYQTDPELTAFQVLDGEDFLIRSVRRPTPLDLGRPGIDPPSACR